MHKIAQPRGDDGMLSIITVVKNDADALRETLLSVAIQSYPNIEVIVVDGDSVDGSQDVARQFARWPLTLISEPDSGIYDAMNKGLALARGEWCQFLNAGDRFYSESSAAVLCRSAEDGNVIVAGSSTDCEADGGTIYKRARSKAWLLYGMPAHHQAMIFRVSHLRTRGIVYDARYVIAADYKFVLDVLGFPKPIYPANNQLKVIDEVVIRFQAGGISQRLAKLGRDEQYDIRRQYFGRLEATTIAALQCTALTLRRRSRPLYSFVRRFV